VLRDNGRPVDAQLKSLRLLAVDGTPTVASILLFGREPLRWVPGAWVQFVRFDGTRITDAIRNERRLEGPLADVVWRLDAVLEANVSVAVDVLSGDVERRRPDYPLASLKQATRNALMHRSYQGSNAPVRVYWFTDRVEIDSPSGLHGRVTPENFGTGITDYRKPLVAEGMRVLGNIQRFGVVIPLIRQELAANGNPPPEFEFSAARVLTRMRRRAQGPDGSPAP
jgi:ATP-dependent DNA helicase RecG